jgi:hypothetical protein
MAVARFFRCRLVDLPIFLSYAAGVHIICWFFSGNAANVWLAACHRQTVGFLAQFGQMMLA